ncbi:hypothetical protein [Paraburkholderia caledonica]
MKRSTVFYLVVLVAYLAYTSVAANDCGKSGGALVRGLSWTGWVCVKESK